VIREHLKPEENTTKHSTRVIATRCVASHEFLKELKEKDNKSERSGVQENFSDSSESENRVLDKNNCAECGGA
jgi:hypothetical protein